MSNIKAGDTVRILHDDASEAPVKAGQCGYVTNVAETEDGSVITARVGGTAWLFMEDDLQVLNVAESFSETVAELRDLVTDFATVAALYDEPVPVDGVPVEVVPVEPAPVAMTAKDRDDIAAMEEDGEDDEDDDDADPCEECPDTAHYHESDGTAVVLPSISFEDGDGDKVSATDVSGMAPQGSVDAVIRIIAPRLGGIFLETHLTAAQAVALGEYLINQFAEGEE